MDNDCTHEQFSKGGIFGDNLPVPVNFRKANSSQFSECSAPLSRTFTVMIPFPQTGSLRMCRVRYASLILLSFFLLASVITAEERDGAKPSSGLSDTILFGTDSVTLSAEAEGPLRQLAIWMRDSVKKDVAFQIQGHTSDLGGEKLNLSISVERAETVRDFLITESGASADRFSIKAYGESNPANATTSQDTPSERMAKRVSNQRVVICCVDENGAVTALSASPEWSAFGMASNTRGIGVQPPGTTQPEPSTKEKGTPELTELVDAANHVSAELFRELGKANPGKSLLISPLSIVEAMWMTAAGSAGETEAEMRDVLGIASIDAPSQKIQLDILHGRYADLAGSTESTFRVANALALVGKVGSALPAYKETLSADFDAEFLENATADSVNQWVAEKTDQKILNLLETLEVDDRLVILNALYFKANWLSRFAKEETLVRTFARHDGAESQVPMMHRTGRFGASITDDWEAVRLEYAGDGMAMIAVLPKPGSQRQLLESGLDEADWKKLLSDISKEQELSLALPRFQLDEKQSLKAPFQDLGMEKAFGRGADFSRMSHEALTIGKIIHAARLEVNEEGSEAAAATAVVMKTRGFGRQPLQISFNRPFLFGIVDTKTGMVAMSGRVMSL